MKVTLLASSEAVPWHSRHCMEQRWAILAPPFSKCRVVSKINDYCYFDPLIFGVVSFVAVSHVAVSKAMSSEHYIGYLAVVVET